MDGIFILHGIKKTNIRPPKALPKITPKTDKRKGGRITTKETYDGYSFTLANNFCAKFEGEGSDGEKICWWDHHPCDDPVVRLPYEYSRTRDKDGFTYTFRGPGIFCDIFCMWAYLCEEGKKIPALRDTRYDNLVTNTKIAHELMFDEESPLKPAPDWRLLQRYGGALTIEQLRKGSYDKVHCKTPNIVFSPAIIQYLIQ